MAEILAKLSEYQVSLSSGFLPTDVPLERLPYEYYEPWESLAAALPQLIADGALIEQVSTLRLLTTDLLSTVEEWRRAYVVLGFLTNGYIFCRSPPSEILPLCLAQPMMTVSAHLGLPCVPTYSGQTLWNYRRSSPASSSRTDVDVDVDMDGLETQVSFTASPEESAFFCISVAIEACGAPLVPLVLDAIQAARESDSALVARCLGSIRRTLDDITSLLPRLHVRCRPSFFYHSLRPYLEGTRDLHSVGLSSGVFFETTDGGSYQKHRGPSNAQSALFPFIDIALGVEHEREHGANSFLQEMRSYIPAPHRTFLADVERVVNIRAFVSRAPPDNMLHAAYEACLVALARFRQIHMQIVARYVVIMANSRPGIAKPAGTDTSKPVSIAGSQGTGGTKPIEFLKFVRNDVLLSVQK